MEEKKDEEEDKEEEDGGSSKPRAKRNPPRSRRVNDVDYTEQQHHDEDEEDSDGSIKPRAKKKPRKKANAAVGGGGDDRPASLLSSIDLLNSKTTPKIVAEALLALLPKAATKHDAAAKTLMKAFPIITAELEARTSALTRKTESEGTRLPIAFYFPLAGTANDGEEGEGGTSSVVVHIPEECFIKMFTFLNGKEVVNVSTVNKVWLSISRKPEVWSRLDLKNGLSWNKAKRLNMTSLLALLGRPQFANLKHLQLPSCCKVGKNSLRSISKACPNLETFDMGGSRGNDSDLLSASQIFSNLTGLHFGLGDISNNGIMSAVRMMGNALLDLRIRSYGLDKYLSDEAVGVIAEFCPNLKYFDYSTGLSVHSAVKRDLSANSITCLIRKCRRLEVLELGFIHAISRDDFAAILSMLEHDDNKQHALRKIHLRGYPFVIGDKPFTITENLSTYVFKDKIYFN
jgi:hypothetical protein